MQKPIDTSQQALSTAAGTKKQHAAVTEEHILVGLLQEDSNLYLLQQTMLCSPL